MKIWLDPPLSRLDWQFICGCAALAFFAGYAYGRWVFGL